MKEKTVTVVQVPVPAGFRAQLEQLRISSGARSWAEAIRKLIDCPQPGTPEWDALVEKEGQGAQ